MVEKPKPVIRLKKTHLEMVDLRSHPQLKINEEIKFTNHPDETTLMSELPHLQELLTREQEIISYKPFEDPDLFSKYNPEALELLTKPPDQLYGQPPQYDPDFHGIRFQQLTNREQYSHFFYLWQASGWRNTPEGENYLVHEKIFIDLHDKIRIINDKIEWLHWVTKVIATPPIPITMEGLTFIDHLIARPDPTQTSRLKSHRKGKTENQIYSLCLPLFLETTPQTTPTTTR